LKEIPITQGKVAIVDDSDFESLNQWRWYAAKARNTFYAVRKDSSSGRRVNVHMHRLILGAKAGQFVDHIDGNGLHNFRSNLRICNHTENLHNRGANRDNTSGYKGVSFRRKASKFHAQIDLNGQKIYLGSFECRIEAARHYDAAALLFHGRFARINGLLETA
jgi:hypothetical protein